MEASMGMSGHSQLLSEATRQDGGLKGSDGEHPGRHYGGLIVHEGAQVQTHEPSTFRLGDIRDASSDIHVDFSRISEEQRRRANDEAIRVVLGRPGTADEIVGRDKVVRRTREYLTILKRIQAENEMNFQKQADMPNHPPQYAPPAPGNYPSHPSHYHPDPSPAVPSPYPIQDPVPYNRPTYPQAAADAIARVARIAPRIHPGGGPSLIQDRAALEPQVRVTLRLRGFSIPMRFHDVAIQDDAEGAPMAIYLKQDLRHPTEQVALDTIEEPYSLEFAAQPGIVFPIEDTGMRCEFGGEKIYILVVRND